MYRPAAFAIDDLPRIHAFVRERGFATVTLATNTDVQFAYAPVFLASDEGPKGTLRFHLARNNPVASAARGARLHFSFLGPDAYVSPDWYASTGMVPTWNYLAAEGYGVARKLNEIELRRLLADLSAEREHKLLPKQPWTLDKVPAARMSTLLSAIDGFEVSLESLSGKFKLSQNLKREDFEGALRGLESRGEPASAAIAHAMRKSTVP